MATTDTMQVRTKESEQPVTINRADFNPNLHEPWHETVVRMRKPVKRAKVAKSKRHSRRAA